MTTPSLADLDAMYPLPPHELSRQWVLAMDDEAGPPGWSAFHQGDLRLSVHPDAHVCTLRARGGGAIGWAIEPLAYLGPNGDCVPSGDLELAVDPDFSPEAMEAALYGRAVEGWSNGDGLAGNWTAVVASEDGQTRRVYLGPTHSVVYAPDQRLIATSHNLIPGLTRDVALSRAVNPIATAAFYNFGLTAFRGLKRLLPNHALDLRRFEAVRHWPVRAFEPRTTGVEGAERIVDHARRLLRVLALRYDRFKVPLSAGRDSRATLALLRPFADESPHRLELFTSTRSNGSYAEKVDVQIARKVAAIARLPLTVEVQPPRPVEPADLARVFVRLGESKFGPILSAAVREVRAPPDDVIALPGMAGETARGYYWSGWQPDNGPLDAAQLVRLTHSPPHESVLSAAARWLDHLPAAVRSNDFDVLDLAYVEQRMGCWDASSRYLFPGRGRANTSLMATALAIETMLRLPQQYRAKRALQHDMVRYAWPELLGPPFNEPLGLLRLKRFGRQLPTLVPRGIRWAMRRLRPSAEAMTPRHPSGVPVG